MYFTVVSRTSTKKESLDAQKAVIYAERDSKRAALNAEKASNEDKVTNYQYMKDTADAKCAEAQTHKEVGNTAAYSTALAEVNNLKRSYNDAIRPYIMRITQILGELTALNT